jgi:hypothetical protein
MTMPPEKSLRFLLDERHDLCVHLTTDIDFRGEFGVFGFHGCDFQSLQGGFVKLHIYDEVGSTKHSV